MKNNLNGAWLLACWLLFYSVNSFAEVQTTAINWHKWSDAVFAQAKAENKLVLLDLSADWCAFCKKMDATTYQDPEVLASIKQYYLPVRIHNETDPALAVQYAHYGFPGTVIFNAQGTELLKKKGYIKPQFMYWTLEAVAQNPAPQAHR
ncbi:thioredoxin family protein [Candidatus Venteria ishoeyi]|uniref:Thiol:disulfide interchange protein DsbD n=1 Tax=Candidatus Venteria ishoeyi TaxID=1899563 RepID=A0A1H6FAP0_9GAMM|nr:DUF255 domain-containing protein [Candidatus Venteria ishoeyi]SEH06441.1 Thiol:disulfide interchange protein DsbD precursor [Candidatus Venteria ishoeyi]